MRSMATHPRRFTLRRSLAVAAVLVGLTATSALPAQAAGSGFWDGMDSFNSSRWAKANGYSNGSMFNVGWRSDHAWNSGGVMGLNLNNTPCSSRGCSGKPYASGEYRTTDRYSYGRYEVRMK